MGKFYQYDTRGASAADQIMTLERLLEESNDKLNDLIEEHNALLSDWNAIVAASGSPTNGGAVGHVVALVNERNKLKSLLRDCLPELDGEGVTIHRVWAALGCKS